MRGRGKKECCSANFLGEGNLKRKTVVLTLCLKRNLRAKKKKIRKISKL